MLIAVDVIVRTRADSARSQQLFRALDSIHDQRGITAWPIVVVNGERYDKAVFRMLENRADVLLHYQQPASAGLAKNIGRSKVTAPYFCFLDDDDYFIKDSLLQPLTWLDTHPACDVVVTNGYSVRDGKAENELTHQANHVASPALSFLDENWLDPGAGFFRTQSINATLFDTLEDHHEWGYLAFSLCRKGKQLHFMDVPTVMYSADTFGSLSKIWAHREAELKFLRFIHDNAGADRLLRRKAERKYRNALHIMAWEYLKRGQPGRAWRYHLASLRPPYTFKYLMFSRKLLWWFGRQSIRASRHPGAD